MRDRLPQFVRPTLRLLLLLALAAIAAEASGQGSGLLAPSTLKAPMMGHGNYPRTYFQRLPAVSRFHLPSGNTNHAYSPAHFQQRAARPYYAAPTAQFPTANHAYSPAYFQQRAARPYYSAPTAQFPTWHNPYNPLDLTNFQGQGTAAAATTSDEPPSFGGGPSPAYSDFYSSGQFRFWNGVLDTEGVANWPVPGRTKVMDGNSALPRDRVFVRYYHFHNALDAAEWDGAGATLGTNTTSVNRAVVGFEKAFREDLWSVEFRLPTSQTDGFGLPTYQGQRGGLGNLSIITKRLLVNGDVASVGAGLGVSVPTGDDSQFRVGNDMFTRKNQAAHLFPFMGWLFTPTERSFYQAFLQLDIPLAGNDIEYTNAAGGGPVNMGQLTEQVFVYVDVSAGYWLYRNPNSQTAGINGVAVLTEIHYTTNLNSPGILSGTGGNTDFQFGNGGGVDVVNLTIGIDTEVGSDTLFRVGGVVPLTGSDNNFFDSEIQAAVHYRF